MLGSKVANGSSAIAYLAKETPSEQDCNGATRICTNVVLTGTYSFLTCQFLPAHAAEAHPHLRHFPVKPASEQTLDLMYRSGHSPMHDLSAYSTPNSAWGAQPVKQDTQQNPGKTFSSDGH